MPRTHLTDLSIKKLPHPTTGSVKYWDTALPGFGVRVSKNAKSYILMRGAERKLVTLARVGEISLRDARKQAVTYKVPSEQPDDLREQFLAARSHLRHNTLRQYRYYLLNDITEGTHAIASWKAYYNWLMAEGHADRNPYAGKSTKTRERDRLLTDAEVAQLWQLSGTFGNLVKMLTITGQRRSEVGRLEQRESTYYLPADVSKNGHAHEIPRTAMMDRYYTPSTFSGWSKATKDITIPDFRLHDIRRYYASTHAKLGTPIHVVEALLNHRSGTVSGIAAIYIRHNFLDAATTAQLAYEDHIKTILEG